MKTLVIIPAYNEENNLEKLIESINQYNLDYIIINDCSKDNTKLLCKKNNYNVLNLPNNMGLANVCLIGYKYAYEHNYQICVCIDGDGQHPTDKINDLVSEIENGYDYVIGSRFVSIKKPFTLRMIGSRLISLFIKLKTFKTIEDPTSGMRAFNTKVLKDFINNYNFYAEPDICVYLLKKGYKLKEVEVNMNNRVLGVSYFSNPFKSIKFMISVFISIFFIQ